jgi:hypothetical protein
MSGMIYLGTLRNGKHPRFFQAMSPRLLPPIEPQSCAQRSQAATHESIPSMARQLSAQAVQTVAHAAHTCACACEPLVMKLAAVWQISAQSAIFPTCSGRTWAPPMGRQC